MLEARFVKFIPDRLKKGVIYVSYEYNTVIHLCACGCGNKVVTPITPIQWSYSYNGESISLSPSIGNWNFDCKSHYWVRDSQFVWAENWSEDKISKVQQNEQKEIIDFFEEKSERKEDGFITKIFKYLKMIN
nr:DUF6527 family protein [Polaribacter sp. 20A6]